MVLHHVAQRTGIVVETLSAFEANRLADRDLHVIDAARVPQRLEHHVGKAQRHQVLDRFLAKVMVDPEDLFLGKGGGDSIVDPGGRSEIVAQRFFKADPDIGMRQPRPLQAFDGWFEQEWCGRQENRQAARGITKFFSERPEAIDIRGIKRLVFEPFEEACQLLVIAPVFWQELG
jgi:hypothetical protein